MCYDTFMKLKIVKDSNPIMKKKSLPVELPLSQEDKKTLDDMLEYLKLSQDEDYSTRHNIRSGIGMAAIQIGLLKRMFVVINFITLLKAHLGLQ